VAASQKNTGLSPRNSLRGASTPTTLRACGSPFLGTLPGASTLFDKVACFPMLYLKRLHMKNKKNNDNFAIARIEKYASSGGLKYLLNHHLRTTTVPNADPAKLHLNRVLMKVDDPQKFIDDIPKGSKKNACRFVDMLFTATQFEDKKQLQQWTDETLAYAQKFLGKDNIALAVLHVDETTPHIHIIFKPVNPHTKKLGAGHWFDGREKMQKFQDTYHQAVSALGFDRGVKGSRAHHKTIKQFYADIHHAQVKYTNFMSDIKTAYQSLKDAKPKFLDFSQQWKQPTLDAFKNISRRAAAVAYLEQTTDRAEVERLKKVETEHQQQKILLTATQEKLRDLTGSTLPTSSEVSALLTAYKLSQDKLKIQQQREREAAKPPQKENYQSKRKLPSPL